MASRTGLLARSGQAHVMKNQFAKLRSWRELCRWQVFPPEHAA
jgi:hypothetical protein